MKKQSGRSDLDFQRPLKLLMLLLRMFSLEPRAGYRVKLLVALIFLGLKLRSVQCLAPCFKASNALECFDRMVEKSGEVIFDAGHPCLHLLCLPLSYGIPMQTIVV